MKKRQEQEKRAAKRLRKHEVLRVRLNKEVLIKGVNHTPKNNWEMATALRDGTPCRVHRKYVKDVLEALGYHTLKANIEIDGDLVTITPL